MSKKMKGPAAVCCCDCRHERPVTGEFPAYDGTPVFCTCPYQRYYRQRRWALPCAYYEAKNDEAIPVSPTSRGGM